MSQRFLRGVAALVGALSLAVIPLSASAAPTLNWTDLSGQLTTRTNRPVWAMAYASPYWFYTDGHDLWDGGQVYRYDGQTQTNITVNVRNAGISRVDDIVSDGTSVLFLKGVAAKNNQFEVLKYTNGSYLNVSSAIRGAFSNNEGLKSVVGRNGDWYLTTSNLRVLKWNGTTANPSGITLPSSLQEILNVYQNENTSGYFSYCSDSIENNACSLKIVPISGGQWLLTSGKSAYHTNGAWRDSVFYKYNGSTFTDITDTVRSVIGGAPLTAVSSNGDTAIVTAIGFGGGESLSTFVSGSDVRKITLPCNHDLWLVCDPLLTEKAIWTGSRWILPGNNKYLYTLTSDGIVTFVGEMRDYFIDGASNGNGTILLGGAVSVLGNTQPTSPLTAKLSKVTEGTATTNNTTTNTTNQTSSGIASWTWLTPNQNTIRRDENLTFNIGAWDADGLSRIEIVVNGSTVKTCELGGATGNQNCAVSLWGGNYPLGTVASMNAKITDAKGNAAWTPIQNINVLAASNAGTTTNTTQPTSDIPTSHWSWSSPETATLATNQSVLFTVGAWDGDGMRSADFYVNGYVWQTCSFGDVKSNVECAVVLNGANWNVGGGVYVNAKLTDAKGNVTWTAFRQYAVVAATSNATTNSTSNTTSQTTSVDSQPGWVTIASNRDGGFHTGDAVTFTANGGDANGIKKIEIYVDGVLVKTCAGTSACAYSTTASSGRSVIYYGATLYDNAGYSSWSGYKSINRI